MQVILQKHFAHFKLQGAPIINMILITLGFFLMIQSVKILIMLTVKTLAAVELNV